MIEDFKVILTRLEQEELRISNIVDIEIQAEELQAYKAEFNIYIKEFKNQLYYSSKYLQHLITARRTDKIQRMNKLSAKAEERRRK